VRLGVLDIGSNSVHFLVVDAHYGAAPVPAHKSKVELQLAQTAAPDGAISSESIAALVDFIHASQELSDGLGVNQTIAFATSAIRDAPNQSQLREQVLAETSVDIDVLSGEVEAELTFLAVRRWLGWSAGRIMVFDIGGGSLEIAVGEDEEPDNAVSLPLGAGSLTRRFIREDPPQESEIKALRKYVRLEVAATASLLSKGEKPRIFVGTSKTLKQLARIAGAKESSAGPYADRRLTLQGVQESISRLSSLPDSQRKQISGVSTVRSGQLLAGALVAEAAMELFHAEELAICPWALREGVILRALDALSK